MKRTLSMLSVCGALVLGACAPGSTERVVEYRTANVESDTQKSKDQELSFKKSSDPLDLLKIYYKQIGDCSSGLTRTFLRTKYVRLGRSLDGKDVLAKAYIAVRENKTFELGYSEQDVDQYVETDIASTRYRNRNLVGQWKYEGNDIVLGDVAVISPVIVDGRNAMQIRYLKNIASVNLAGMNTLVEQFSTNEFPFSYDQICMKSFEELSIRDTYAARNKVEDQKLRSLQMPKNFGMFSQGFAITGMELFIHRDGTYDWVANLSEFADTRSRRNVVVEHAQWEASGENIILKSAEVKKNAYGRLEVNFSKEMKIEFNGYSKSLDLTGYHFEVIFAESSFTMDDLTSTLKGGSLLQ